MASRFIQGDGYPVLYRYNSADTLLETINMPYVRDDGSKSYIRQTFEPYPDSKLLHHDLLSGGINEDKAMGYKFRCEIKYSSILASDLDDIYNCLINAMGTAGNYLKLKPRNDHNGTYNLYKVVFEGNIDVQSGNIFTHNITLNFIGMDLVSTSLIMQIPPV